MYIISFVYNLMLKKILSVLAGLTTATVVVSLLELALPHIYPPPPEFDPAVKAQTVESMRQWISMMPLSAYFYVIVTYALAAFAGGSIATLISPTWGRVPLWLIIGIALMITESFDIIPYGYPVWFTCVSMLSYIPLAYIGSKTVLKKKLEIA